MANHLKDLSGQRFGRWTVENYAGRRGQASVWSVRCDCGTRAIVNGGNLRSGLSRSCGCIAKEGGASRPPRKTGGVFIDLTGRTFTRWTVLERAAGKGKWVPAWLCRCECGTERVVTGANLRSAKSRSCGCLQGQIASETHLVHGRSGTGLHQSWAGMLDRCFNVRGQDYADYGGRGITVCERWRDAAAFCEDMGPSWSEGMTIDRKDPNGNYEPDNCQWIPQSEQWRNRRNTLWVDTPWWGRMRLKDAAEKSGLSYDLLQQRVRAGWGPERLFLPSRSPKSRNRFR